MSAKRDRILREMRRYDPPRGPVGNLVTFATWVAGAGRYVEDGAGAVWYAGCGGGWVRQAGDRAHVEGRIRSGALRGEVQS